MTIFNILETQAKFQSSVVLSSFPQRKSDKKNSDKLVDIKKLLYQQIFYL